MFYAKGPRFVDELGRTRIFHGVNFIDKGYNDLTDWTSRNKATDLTAPRTYGFPTDDNFYKTLAKKGFNLMRLGVTWDGIEPKMGEYNQEYLQNIADVFDVAARYGIYIFIDIHQDLYSGFGNGIGDGAPSWACKMKKGRVYKSPRFGIWAEPYFFGKPVAECFDAFWQNSEVDGMGLQDRYALMIKEILYKVKDKENFFGFDFMNEPFPGSLGTKVFRKVLGGVIKEALFDPKFRTIKLISSFIKGDNKTAYDCITPDALKKASKGAGKIMKKFDLEYHNPFINKMTTAMREVTDQGLIVVSNSYWCNIGIPYFGGPANNGDKVEPNQCFAPHAYDFMVDTDDYNYASDARLDYMLDSHQNSQSRLNVPVILGEWGCTCFNGDEWLKHIEHITEELDKRQWSNCYFSSKDIIYSIPNVYDITDRPYPVATAGEITSFEYDKENGTFDMTYIVSSKEPTVLSMKEMPKEIVVDGTYEIEEKFERVFINITANNGERKISLKF